MPRGIRYQPALIGGDQILLITVRAVANHELKQRDALFASILLALAVLTRLDSVIVGFATIPFCIGILRTSVPTGKQYWQTIAALSIPAVSIIGTWFAWKFNYYGDFVPNTFHAKVSGRSIRRIIRGGVYVGWLFISYWWLPLLLILSVLHRKRFLVRKSCTPKLSELMNLTRSPIAPLVCFTMLWLLYVVWIGGDFMEFRQLVPVIPIVIILMMLFATEVLKSGAERTAFVACLIAGSVSHALFFPHYVRPRGIDPIPSLRSYVSADPTSWRSMGMQLHRDLGDSSDVSIAVSPAGAIPYFSGLRTIDVLGLNDAWVARNGQPMVMCFVCLGHSRQATIAYLRDRRVNLVLGDPQIVPRDAPAADGAKVIRHMFFDEPLNYAKLPADLQLLRIPLGRDSALAAIYLTPSPEVDQLISKGVWMAQKVSRLQPGR